MLVFSERVNSKRMGLLNSLCGTPYYSTVVLTTLHGMVVAKAATFKIRLTHQTISEPSLTRTQVWSQNQRGLGLNPKPTKRVRNQP